MEKQRDRLIVYEVGNDTELASVSVRHDMPEEMRQHTRSLFGKMFSSYYKCEVILFYQSEIDLVETLEGNFVDVKRELEMRTEYMLYGLRVKTDIGYILLKVFTSEKHVEREKYDFLLRAATKIAPKIEEKLYNSKNIPGEWTGNINVLREYFLLMPLRELLSEDMEIVSEQPFIPTTEQRQNCIMGGDCGLIEITWEYDNGEYEYSLDVCTLNLTMRILKDVIL